MGKLQAERKFLEQQKLKVTGKRETKWEEDLIKTKIEKQKYFGGQAMTWNVVDNLYKDVEAEIFTFLEAFKDKSEIYRNHVEIWKILTAINYIVSKKNATIEELETGAMNCELFCERFSVLFPSQNITRKMHVLSCVLPRYVREGNVYKYLKILQKGENLHAVFNQLERRFINVKIRYVRYFLMLKEYYNMLKTDTSMFDKQKKKIEN